MKITIELEELIDLLTKKKLTTGRVPNTGWLQEAINLVAKGTDYKKVGRILTRKGYTTKHGKPISGGAVSAAIWRFNHNVETGYARKNQ